MASRRKPSKVQTDEFSAARRAFERWRRDRSGPTRIPEPLWTSAVRLARKHGVNPTAKELGLDYYSLKKRLEATSSRQAKSRRPKRAASGKSAFVELPLASLSKREGFAFVLETGDAKLRFEFDSAPDAENLETMARALLKAAQ